VHDIVNVFLFNQGARLHYKIPNPNIETLNKSKILNSNVLNGILDFACSELKFGEFVV